MQEPIVETMKASIPTNCKIRVTFQYGPSQGYFHIWPSGHKWQWEALGNNGEEVTANKAIEAARKWIIESQTN